MKPETYRNHIRTFHPSYMQDVFGEFDQKVRLEKRKIEICNLVKDDQIDDLIELLKTSQLDNQQKAKKSPKKKKQESSEEEEESSEEESSEEENKKKKHKKKISSEEESSEDDDDKKKRKKSFKKSPKKSSKKRSREEHKQVPIKSSDRCMAKLDGIDTSDEEELERAFQNALGRSFRDKKPPTQHKKSWTPANAIIQDSQKRIDNMTGGGYEDESSEQFFPIYVLLASDIPSVYADMFDNGDCLDFFNEDGTQKENLQEILNNWNEPVHIC